MINGLLESGMGKIARRAFRKLYLEEWLEARGRDRAGAAKAAGVDISYINNMIAGRRKNPAAHVLLAISEYLDITVNDLFRPPPPADTIAAMGGLSPAAIAALLSQRR